MRQVFIFCAVFWIFEVVSNENVTYCNIFNNVRSSVFKQATPTVGQKCFYIGTLQCCVKAAQCLKI